MLEDYDMSERAQVNEQLNVTVNFFIQGLSAIDEVNMDYEITIFFRQVSIRGPRVGRPTIFWSQIFREFTFCVIGLAG